MKLRRLKKLRQAYRKRTFTQIVQWTLRKNMPKLLENLRRYNVLFQKMKASINARQP